jgi:hypothetical protein
MTINISLANLISLIAVIISFLTLAFAYISWKKNYKQIEKENRKEFIVATLKDEKMPLTMRQAAAVEYIDSNYNGIMRQYIIENKLYIKN